MDKEYLIENIGRNALPHYERLAALRVIARYLIPDSWNGTCDEGELPQWEPMFLKEPEFFSRNFTGFLFWGKYYYTMTKRGEAYFKAYCGKVATVSKSIFRLFNNDEKWKVVSSIREELHSIIKKEFRNVADFTVQRDVVNGHFIMSHSTFKSLLMFSHHYMEMVQPSIVTENSHLASSLQDIFLEGKIDPFEIHLLTDYVSRGKISQNRLHDYFFAEDPPSGVKIKIQ